MKYLKTFEGTLTLCLTNGNFDSSDAKEFIINDKFFKLKLEHPVDDGEVSRDFGWYPIVHDDQVYIFYFYRGNNKWSKYDMISGIGIISASNDVDEFKNKIRPIKIPESWVLSHEPNRYGLAVCRDIMKSIFMLPTDELSDDAKILQRVKKYLHAVKDAMVTWKTMGDIMDFISILKIQIKKDLTSERFDL